MITEEKTPNEKRLFKILIALILIICVIILAQFAWAKYMTSLNGNSKADIAKWSLKVNKETNESFTINLSTTRGEKQEAEVQDGFIGPGTSGEFIIEVDATDTEVSLEYNINMAVDYNDNTVFSKNLIFYSDPEMKNAIYHAENGITLNGFIAQSDEYKTIPHTIYWKWDFETGKTQTQKDSNDIADSYWIGQNISIPITVVGKQVNQNPIINQYEVTFDLNGGIIDGYGNAEKITKIMNENEQANQIPIPNKQGYKFDGYYATKNMSYYITDYPSQDTKRLYLQRETAWAMSNEDVGIHIEAKINLSGSRILSEPRMVEFNDLALTKDLQYYIYGNSGNWVLYLDFDITKEMLEKREYKGSVFDYSKLRLLDIEGTNYCDEDVVCSVDYFILTHQQYYNSDGNLALDEQPSRNVTIYAKWIED